jgi:hypothetical protein
MGRGASKKLPMTFEQLVFIVNTFQRATDLPVLWKCAAENLLSIKYKNSSFKQVILL